MGSTNRKVYNATETSGYKPKGGKSWIFKYKSVTKSKDPICVNIECRNTINICGAHLVLNKEDCDDYDRTFIAPFCKACNHRSKVDAIEIREDTKVMMISSYYVVKVKHLRR